MMGAPQKHFAGATANLHDTQALAGLLKVGTDQQRPDRCG